MKKYNAIKIHFKTKHRSKYKIEGDAYYIYNENCEIIKQFIQIDYANYRHTDRDMLKTKYYKKRKIISIRKKYFEIDEINKISKNDNPPRELSKEKIKEINKDLLRLERVKTSIDLFTGSNSIGSRSFPNRTQIPFFEKDDLDFWLNGANFTNPLNDLTKRHSKVIINNLEEDITCIDFTDIIDDLKFQKIVNLIKDYNQLIFYLRYESVSKDPIIHLHNEVLIKKSKKGSEKYYYEEIEDTISQLEGNIISEVTCEKRLRTLQKYLLGYEIKNHSDGIHFIEGDAMANHSYEYAHIISVLYSKNNYKFRWIGDPNNCMLVSPNFHSLYDKDLVSINSDGEIIGKKKLNYGKIRDVFLTEKRIKFIKENYKYYKINNRNK
ncbi:MAG: MAG4270 family putative restriction endonuclease [Mycoplasmoidaceae bacterium]